MLERPLHHCYIVSADSVTACTEVLADYIGQLFTDNNTEPIFDIDIVDTLTIDMARELRSRGHHKAAGEVRCIIRGFNTATPEAQNALLKIIESPSIGTHFFFITTEPSHLLETVHSRSYLLSDICSKSIDTDTDQLAKDFLSATGLAQRLEIAGKLNTRDQLRVFVKHLASADLSRKNTDFGEAVELVADWSRDTGASVKLLGQLLAVTASNSLKEK